MQENADSVTTNFTTEFVAIDKNKRNVESDGNQDERENDVSKCVSFYSLFSNNSLCVRESVGSVIIKIVVKSVAIET